jgi:hypothetical protein
MPVEREWTVACRDLAGRRRAVTVVASEGKVVLMAPPGEAAVLSPLDAIVSVEDPANTEPAPPQTNHG